MRLAIVITHPIQYIAPWFQYLATQALPLLKVFYLWDGGANPRMDAGFGRIVSWDIPMLEGYTYEFVPNRARQTGPSSIVSLDNPQLLFRIACYKPDAILLFGYNYLSYYRFLFNPSREEVPLLFRGDSHRLVVRRGLKELVRRLWICKVLRKFSAFLYVGEANRAYFHHHGVKDEQLFFVPHAVNNDWFCSCEREAKQQAADLRAKLGIASFDKVILFAGKFEEKKKPRDLLKAFQHAKLDNTVLVLAGSGAQEADLRRDAAQDPNIMFLPFQNQTQMPRTYMLGDIFVLPSYGSGETWGLTVNEAMCMGRPIIVSDHVGCAKDLVHHECNGLVIPAGDTLAFSKALRYAVSDAERLKVWGAQSRRIIQHYSYQHATEGLLRALTACAGSR